MRCGVWLGDGEVEGEHFAREVRSRAIEPCSQRPSLAVLAAISAFHRDRNRTSRSFWGQESEVAGRVSLGEPSDFHLEAALYGGPFSPLQHSVRAIWF